MPKVTIPPAFRGPTHGAHEVWVEGRTIKECLGALEHRFPGFQDLLYDSEGQIPNFVRLFVNDNQVDVRAPDTRLAPDDEVTVLAAIAGG